MSNKTSNKTSQQISTQVDYHELSMMLQGIFDASNYSIITTSSDGIIRSFNSDNAIAKWEIDKEETPGIFDLARLLEHEKLMPPYPGSALPSNLQLKYHDNKVLSLTYKDLDIPISNRVELFPADIVKPSVYKKFMAQGTTFYQVESGYPDDVGYKQVMIPISQELRKTIMERYQAFEKSERRQSPP